MRSKELLAVVCLSSALISPRFSFGQFQEPTREELQMTEDPKAPGADAVSLYLEERIDNSLHFHSYYERIKVLTERGKEMATIRIPYVHSIFTVTNIRGRTIHPDGTVVPLTAQPADLTDTKTKGYQVNNMVFTLPTVEVGSILEYRLDIEITDDLDFLPSWRVQKPYFVHKAHFFFAPSGGSVFFYAHVGNGAQVVRNVVGNYTLDISDIPPIPSEDWMPPINSLIWRVNFYNTQYKSVAQFWLNEGKRWAKDADKFANPTKMQQAVVATISSGDTEDQKARKLYAAVMKLDNTSFSREKSKAERKKEKLKPIRNAEDVWKERSGTDDEIALLFVALARAAGLQAYPMQVVDRSRAIFDRDFLSLSQLDDYLAIVVIGGKEVYLDPGQKDCPFGLLHWKHALAGGLRLSAQGLVFGETPSSTYAQSAITRVADVTVDVDGNITGIARFIMSGSEALYWRQLALENDTEEMRKQFKESIRTDIPDGVQADFDHFLGLDDYNSDLMGIVKLSGILGATTAKRFFVPGLFFESHARHPFVAEEKRAIPIDVHYPKLEQDDVTYHLPQGYDVESTPQTTNLTWPDNALLKIGATKIDGNTVNIKRTMAYNYTLLEPKDYSNLHDFYQKVATADQQQLVLNRSSSAKGN